MHHVVYPRRFAVFRNLLIAALFSIGLLSAIFIPLALAPRSLRDVFQSASRTEKKRSLTDFFRTPTTDRAQLSPSAEPLISELIEVSHARFVVVDTDGTGLLLRSQPSSTAQVQETLAEGTRVEQVGADVTEVDMLWKPVRTQSGNEGWVAADYLQTQP